MIPTKQLVNGFALPELGIGTWLMGGAKVRDPHNDDQADIEAIQAALDLGITHIDTAENYAEGHAETLVGEAIKGYDREKLLLTSKVDKSHLRYNEVLKAAEASLKRLGTDYLDLYLIHAPNPAIPLEETMKAMSDLKTQGLIKHIGVSNFAIHQIEEAQSYIADKIVLNQVHYNAKYQEAEKIGLLAYMQDNDMLLEAYRPLQKGRMLEHPPTIIDEMCEKYGRTPAQIYLNWLMTQGNVVTIVKVGTREHLEENLGAVGWSMDFEDVERITREFPGQEEYSDVFPLH